MVLEYRLRPFKELKRSFGVGHISTSRPKLLNEPTLAGNDPPAIVNMPPCDVEYGPLRYISVHRNFPTRAPSTPSRRKQIARMLPSVIDGPGGCLGVVKTFTLIIGPRLPPLACLWSCHGITTPSSACPGRKGGNSLRLRAIAADQCGKTDLGRTSWRWQ
jgi:hypothetical protein